MLKIYDLDYLKQNKAFNSLLKKKAQNIKTKYQKWLRNVDSKTGLQYLTNMIDGLDDNLLNKANFIDHLEIDTPASLKCSQQLTVTLNMLQNDWLAIVNRIKRRGYLLYLHLPLFSCFIKFHVIRTCNP